MINFPHLFIFIIVNKFIIKFYLNKDASNQYQTSSVLAILLVLSIRSSIIQSCGQSEGRTIEERENRKRERTLDKERWKTEKEKNNLKREKEEFGRMIDRKVKDLISANTSVENFVHISWDLIELRGSNLSLNFSITNCYIFAGDFVAFVIGEPHIICKGVDEYFVDVMKQYEAWVNTEKWNPLTNQVYFASILEKRQFIIEKRYRQKFPNP